MNPTSPPTDERKSARRKALWIFIVVLLAALGAVAVERRKLDRNVPVATFQNPDAGAHVSGVGCVGRIAPENGTFFVSAQASGGRIPVIEQLRIKEGQELSVGEIMAVLDSRSHLESAVREAQARVNLAEVRLVRVKAGANPGESEVIKAEIARLEILRDAAQRDYSRNEPLFKQDFISKAQIDTLGTRVRESDALIRQANDRLAAIAVVRKEDIDLADAEVRAAQADLEHTQLEVATSYVRSPSRARVLRVIAHTGEPIGPAGIAELAETQRMMVIAEVYETDIPRVHIGQKATVKSELLPHALEGVVAYISPQVQPQRTISGVPGAPSDARVFEVRIKVPETEVLASRISGRVDVVIAP
jgi:HlyD family secretion protein